MLVVVFGAAGGVSAQTPTARAPEANGSSVDASKLGVSLDRIRRELNEPPTSPGQDGVLKLNFTVEVVGVAPKINFLEGFAVSRAVPYGSPTHAEVLDVLTPKEFRSPVIPFSALAVWAAQKLSDKSRKQRCEEELAEYKRLVMAGVAVAAPRCSQ